MERILKIQNSILYTDEVVKKIFQDYISYNSTFLQELANIQTPEEKYNQNLSSYRNDNQMLTKNPNEFNTNPENLYNENFINHSGININTGTGEYTDESSWLVKANQVMNSFGIGFPLGGNQQPVSDELIIGAIEAAGLTVPAALAGTNMGQVEGPLYIPPKATVEERAKAVQRNLVSNGYHAVMGFLSNGSSINPGVSKLVNRLETFNYGVDKDATEQEKYVARLDPDNTKYVKNNWRISAKTGDAQRGKPNVWGLIQGSATLRQLLSGANADGKNLNTEAVDRAWKNYYKKQFGNNPYNKIYQDFAGSEAARFWGNKNIIPSASSDYLNVVGKFDNNNVVREDSKEQADKIGKDQQFVFYFEEINDISPSWCIFPASVKPPQETFTPEFSPLGNFFGRPEKPVVYTGTSRTIQFEIQLIAQALEDMEDYKERINWLTQRCYAKYEEGTGINVRLPLYKYPPLVRVTLGDLYYRLGGYITSLNVNWGQSHELWEKFLVKKRIPLSCNISLGFTALHDFVPDGDSKFWGWEDTN